MDAILRQLVDAARVAAGALELFPETVDLAELVTQIADSQSPRSRSPRVIVGAGTAGAVFVDPARLAAPVLAFVESLVWWADRGADQCSTARERRTACVVTASRATAPS